MVNINEILARAAALREETALNSISPERAGGIMYDTLMALNELWLQQGAALVISKIYASVDAMEADTNPVSDISGKPLRTGQIVVIASEDEDNGSVYRYNGPDSPSWSLVGKIGNLEPVDSLDSDSTQLPLAAHQGKVLDDKISQLGQKVDGLIPMPELVNGSISGTTGKIFTIDTRVTNNFPINVGGDIHVVCGGNLRVGTICHYAPGKDAITGGTEGTDWIEEVMDPVLTPYTDIIIKHKTNFPNIYVTFRDKTSSSTEITPSEVAQNVSFIFLENSTNTTLEFDKRRTATSFNIGAWDDGKCILSTSGGIVAASGYSNTGFIPIGWAKKLHIYNGIKVNNIGSAFYSENSESSFISGSGINSNDYNIGDEIVVDVPAGAKYVAVTCFTTYKELFYLYAEDVPGRITDIWAKFGQVDSALSVVDGKFTEMLKYTPSIISGKYIDATTGTTTDAPSYDVTDYLLLVSGQIKFPAYFSDAAGVAFYDKNKGFISGYTRGAGVNLGDIVTLNAPANAVFVRITCLHANITSLSVYAILGENTGAVSEAIKTVSFMVEGSLDINLGTLQNGFVKASNGGFVSTSVSRRTEKIRLNATRISITITQTDSDRGAAFYDERGVFISGIDFSQYTLGSSIEVNVPERACFIATSAIKGYASYMSVKNLNMASALNRLVPITGNPCYYNLSSEARTFKKVLCIGDSLTAGRFDYKEGGVTYEFEDQSISWPSFFAAISGRQTTNVGDAGETTKTWWEIHQNDDLSGHDACIIALGRNDYSTYPTTSEERITYMTNIINKVKTDNPQIKIFVSTLINYYTGTDAEAVNEDMRTIASTISDCYLVDISVYGNLIAATDRYSHCTAVGYQKLAECYFRYISYIMANNPADFMTVQFVGTNREY